MLLHYIFAVCILALPHLLSAQSVCGGRGLGYKAQDPEDCHGYYICLGGFGEFAAQCGNGYRFSEAQQHCVIGKCPPDLTFNNYSTLLYNAVHKYPLKYPSSTRIWEVFYARAINEEPSHFSSGDGGGGGVQILPLDTLYTDALNTYTTRIASPTITTTAMVNMISDSTTIYNTPSTPMKSASTIATTQIDYKPSQSITTSSNLTVEGVQRNSGASVPTLSANEANSAISATINPTTTQPIESSTSSFITDDIIIEILSISTTINPTTTQPIESSTSSFITDDIITETLSITDTPYITTTVESSTTNSLSTVTSNSETIAYSTIPTDSFTLSNTIDSSRIYFDQTTDMATETPRFTKTSYITEMVDSSTTISLATALTNTETEIDLSTSLSELLSTTNTPDISMMVNSSMPTSLDTTDSFTTPMSSVPYSSTISSEHVNSTDSPHMTSVLDSSTLTSSTVSDCIILSTTTVTPNVSTISHSYDSTTAASGVSSTNSSPTYTSSSKVTSSDCTCHGKMKSTSTNIVTNDLSKLPNCNMLPNGAYVRDAVQCDKFYICLFGRPIAQYCPPGLCFDDEAYICNFKHLIRCKNFATKKPNNF